jgi:hypothetical protein
MARSSILCPGGTPENSPAIDRWVGAAKRQAPEGAKEDSRHNERVRPGRPSPKSRYYHIFFRPWRDYLCTGVTLPTDKSGGLLSVALRAGWSGIKCHPLDLCGRSDREIGSGQLLTERRAPALRVFTMSTVIPTRRAGALRSANCRAFSASSFGFSPFLRIAGFGFRIWSNALIRAPFVVVTGRRVVLVGDRPDARLRWAEGPKDFDVTDVAVHETDHVSSIDE